MYLSQKEIRSLNNKIWGSGQNHVPFSIITESRPKVHEKDNPARGRESIKISLTRTWNQNPEVHENKKCIMKRPV